MRAAAAPIRSSVMLRSGWKSPLRAAAHQKIFFGALRALQACLRPLRFAIFIVYPPWFQGSVSTNLFMGAAKPHTRNPQASKTCSGTR